MLLFEIDLMLNLPFKCRAKRIMLSVRNTCLSVPERFREVNRMIELLSPCISQRLHCLLACVDAHSSIGNEYSCMEL